MLRIAILVAVRSGTACSDARRQADGQQSKLAFAKNNCKTRAPRGARSLVAATSRSGHADARGDSPMGGSREVARSPKTRTKTARGRGAVGPLGSSAPVCAGPTWAAVLVVALGPVMLSGPRPTTVSGAGTDPPRLHDTYYEGAGFHTHAIGTGKRLRADLASKGWEAPRTRPALFEENGRLRADSPETRFTGEFIGLEPKQPPPNIIGAQRPLRERPRRPATCPRGRVQGHPAKGYYVVDDGAVWEW